MEFAVATLIWTLLLLVPFAMLTTAGLLLWRRWRSVATAMVALGFATTFVSLASSLFAPIKSHAVLSDFASGPPAQQDTYFITVHYHLFPLLALELMGIWVAAVGALWHVRKGR